MDPEKVSDLTALYIIDESTGRYLTSDSADTGVVFYSENPSPYKSWWLNMGKDQTQGTCVLRNMHSFFCARISVLSDGHIYEGKGITIKDVDPDYSVPEPSRIKTDRVIGVQMCNLWNSQNCPGGWDKIIPYSDREPVIGYYDEGDPVVTDWEIKMATDNGVNFFMPCWYRAKGNKGKPVASLLDHWIKSLKKARYSRYIKYMVMWENANGIADGVLDEDDLLTNVTPYLIDNFFKDDCYLKPGNKPVLSIYIPELIINELGGTQSASSAFTKMKEKVIEAGFDGLTLIGQYCWGPTGKTHEQLKECGFDYTMSYHWPTFLHGILDNKKAVFSDGEIIKGQQLCWEDQAKAMLPNIVNCSMGWDSAPWNGSSTTKAWRLTPASFRELLMKAKAFTSGKDEYASRIIMIDNWNEFGEGHYIMPAKEYGFGYLDAVREVFLI